MKYTKRRNLDLAEGDMTPMIDMTFQLIAFFMVLINFTEADQDERVRLPISELAKPPMAPLDNPLTLNLDPDGNIYLAGQQYQLPTLENQLQRERELMRNQGEDPAEATIIIRADEGAKTGVVQELITQCQGVGFEKFALRAKEEER
ncbi:Biopolymer transport protein ExbD [Planctomycetales bacterium 10988]|nr:Biopolymer transport protein ExbD [Planctomycetales bacterium 10988]